MQKQSVPLQGVSLIGPMMIGSSSASQSGKAFRAVNPATGTELDPYFQSASMDDLERSTSLAAAAFPIFAGLPGRDRASLLRRIAEAITTHGPVIVERAHLETGLPLPRLQGELGRTTGQLNLFADLLDEGSWVDSRIDTALPDRKPLPRPDLRSMLRPIGPVAVFGASNFPLAFSVAGGDTASALAAGNPVLVKAHPAHPGTSELVGRVIQQAVADAGLPAGVFALLFDSGIDIGGALVEHPAVKAVGFTGSSAGGKALMRIAAGRTEPIPCYAEMGSTNPLFILPGALQERAAALAAGLQSSFTLGSGQFCTKPGIVFVPEQESETFVQALRSGVATLGGQGMLTPGIAQKYASSVQQRLSESNAQQLAGGQATAPGSDQGTPSPAQSVPAVFTVPLADFLQHQDLEEEIFGPTTLLVHYGSESSLLEAARGLHGHLTATIHATESDLKQATELAGVLESRVGRILFNGYPTGVEVSPAMVHGGPFPATSDGRSSSVGTRAILRFTRPVCFQDFPPAALPPELQPGNPLGIMRLVNGTLTRE